MKCLRRTARGQASVEYLVVLAFSVLLLLKPFSYDDASKPGTTPNQKPALQQLAEAIKDYHKHYTYAMAIAAIPDCDYQLAYDKSWKPSDTETLASLSASVAFDRCVDWTNPQIPMPTGSLDVSLPITTSINNAIKNMITDAVDGFIDSFVNPSGLLGDMINFDPFSFF